LALTGLALLCAGTGFSYWQKTRFPARSIALASTPVELRVQSGVTRRELHAVREGLRLTHRFMSRSLRRSVRKPVEARVARANGCHPFESSSGDSIGEADDGFLCISTRNLHWKYLIQKDFPAAAAIPGHEYVHVLQAELGCLSNGTNGRFRWLVEGMAEEVSWRALISAGWVTDRHVERAIARDALPDLGLGDRGLYPLAAYERANGADREYALWHLAVRRLLRAAVEDGAAPRVQPEIALRRFCERAGREGDWRRAFARSFGEPVTTFYHEFETFRARQGSPAS
jgi:hypothetical protein